MATLSEYLNSLDASFTTVSQEENEVEFANQISRNTFYLLELVAEEDLESLFNLLIPLFVKAARADDDSSEPAQSLCAGFSEDKNVDCSVKLTILLNYYNTLPDHSTSRFILYKSIVNIASTNSQIDAILPTLPKLKSSIKEWGLSAAEKSELYLILSNALGKDHILASYDFLLKHLEVTEIPDSADFENNLRILNNKAKDAVKIAITSKEILEFETLRSLVVVRALKVSPSIQLLNIFQSGSLAEYKTFIKMNPNLLTELGVSEQSILRKLRILILAGFAIQHVGESVDYSSIATALGVELNEVELWVIDGFRSGLIDAKIDQLNNKIFISRSTYRNFGKEEWKDLQEKLRRYKESIDRCIDTVKNVKTA